MPYTITKIFKVDIAERHWSKLQENVRGKELYEPHHTNPEHNIHGHTLFIHVTLESDSLDDGGFVLDTDVIKSLFTESIFGQLDHSFILPKDDPIFQSMKSLIKNQDLKLYEVDFIPTFENLSKHIYEQCKKILEQNKLENIRIKKILIKTRSIEGGYFEVQRS